MTCLGTQRTFVIGIRSVMTSLSIRQFTMGTSIVLVSGIIRVTWTSRTTGTRV